MNQDRSGHRSKNIQGPRGNRDKKSTPPRRKGPPRTREGAIRLSRTMEVDLVYEDNRVMILDKPAGWLVAPETWTQTSRNFQLALMEAMARREHWARVRSLRFLRYVHRLDADTSGLLMVAKSPAAVEAYSMLFRERQVEKGYLAVVTGNPKTDAWTCSGPLLTDRRGRHVTVGVHSKGKPAETHFEVVHRDDAAGRALVWAMPVTGRTHQIRVHLKHGGFPIEGDVLYHPKAVKGPPGLALRAMWLAYPDPYTEKRHQVLASADPLLQNHFPEAKEAFQAFVAKRKQGSGK